MDDELLERIPQSLPPYLAAEDKQALLDQLSGRNPNVSYFGSIDDPEHVQGDGWSGLIARDFDSGDLERMQGLVVSNSCDIAAENRPYPGQRIVFAPIMSLARYATLLAEAGIERRQIDDLLSRIRTQKVYRIFYLPGDASGAEERIVPLDMLHSQPLGSVQHAGLQRMFSLSLHGWYMLLLKLSIHFCRMQERVKRSTVAAG